MDGTYIVAMLLGISVCIIGVAIYSFSQDISVSQDRALIADDFLEQPSGKPHVLWVIGSSVGLLLGVTGFAIGVIGVYLTFEHFISQLL